LDLSRRLPVIPAVRLKDGELKLPLRHQPYCQDAGAAIVELAGAWPSP
jgi:hypothetical protein